MPVAKKHTEPVEVFYSYSHKDEALRNELLTHLSTLRRRGIITDWHDRNITAGTEWESQIDKHLKSAKIILLLISADFMASDYCYSKELQTALRRHKKGLARVIPVILRPVDWKGAEFGKLQALPTDARAVTTWPNRDEAFVDVAKGIRKAIAEMASSASTSAPPGKPVKTPASSPSKPRVNSTKSPAAVEPEARTTRPLRAASPESTVAGARQRQTRTTAPGSGSGQGSKLANSASSLPVSTAAEYLEEAFRNRPKAKGSMGVVWAQVVWVSLRDAAALNPTLFVDRDFVSQVQSVAHSGSHPLFSYGAPNEEQANTKRLHIAQQDSERGGRGGYDLVELTLYANGTVSVALNVTYLKSRDGRDSYDMSDVLAGMRINPDDVQHRMEQAWAYAAQWWRHRYGARAVSQEMLLYNAALFDTSNSKFEKPPQGRTGSVTLSMGNRPNPLMVYNEPKLVSRATLLKPDVEITNALKMLHMRFDELESSARW
jgi:hypothetical protein